MFFREVKPKSGRHADKTQPNSWRVEGLHFEISRKTPPQTGPTAHIPNGLPAALPHPHCRSKRQSTTPQNGSKLQSINNNRHVSFDLTNSGASPELWSRRTVTNSLEFQAFLVAGTAVE